MKALERIRARRRGEPVPKVELPPERWAILVPKASMLRADLEGLFDKCPSELTQGSRFENVTGATFPSKSALIEAISELRDKFYSENVRKVADDAEKYLARRASIQQQIADEEAERESLYWSDEEQDPHYLTTKPSYDTTTGVAPYQSGRTYQERVKKSGSVIEWYRACENLCEINAQECNAYLAALPWPPQFGLEDQETGLNSPETEV